MDRIGEEVRDKLKAINADHDFVDFLLDWHGLYETENEPPEPGFGFYKGEVLSTSQQRTRKRALQRRYGRNWKEKWEEEKFRTKAYTPPVLEMGLTWIQVKRPHDPHRPVHWGFWFSVADLKSYLTEVSGRARWKLITEILFPGKTYSQAQPEWARRSKMANQYDGQRRLTIAKNFYAHHRAEIQNALSKGIPMWVSFPKSERKGLVPIDDLAKIIPNTTVQVNPLCPLQ